MSKLFSDTRPEAEAVLIKLIREVPPWRKFKMMQQLNTTVRTLAITGVRSRYPQADDAEVRRRLADIWLGPELAFNVFGPLENFITPLENEGAIHAGR